MNKTIFTYPVTIQETHLDMFGHVNNAVYLTLFEEARWDFITKNGYGAEKMAETNLAPVILEINMRFLKEIKLNEQIIIQTELISYEGKIGLIKQQMLRDGKVCCIAEFKISLFNLKERKMVLPTPEWLKAIGVS